MTIAILILVAALQVVTIFLLVRVLYPRRRATVTRNGPQMLKPSVMDRLTGKEEKMPEGYGDELLGEKKLESKRWRA